MYIFSSVEPQPVLYTPLSRPFQPASQPASRPPLSRSSPVCTRASVGIDSQPAGHLSLPASQPAQQAASLTGHRLGHGAAVADLLCCCRIILLLCTATALVRRLAAEPVSTGNLGSPQGKFSLTAAVDRSAGKARHASASMLRSKVRCPCISNHGRLAPGATARITRHHSLAPQIPAAASLLKYLCECAC